MNIEEVKRQSRIILKNYSDFRLNSYEKTFLKKISNAKYPLTKKQSEYFEKLKTEKTEKILERIGKYQSEIERLNEILRLIQ